MSEKEDIRLGAYAFTTGSLCTLLLGFWKGVLAALVIVILINLVAVIHDRLPTHKHNG